MTLLGSSEHAICGTCGSPIVVKNGRALSVVDRSFVAERDELKAEVERLRSGENGGMTERERDAIDLLKRIYSGKAGRPLYDDGMTAQTRRAGPDLEGRRAVSPSLLCGESQHPSLSAGASSVPS